MNWTQFMNFSQMGNMSNFNFSQLINMALNLNLSQNDSERINRTLASVALNFSIIDNNTNLEFALINGTFTLGSP